MQVSCLKCNYHIVNSNFIENYVSLFQPENKKNLEKRLLVKEDLRKKVENFAKDQNKKNSLLDKNPSRDCMPQSDVPKNFDMNAFIIEQDELIIIDKEGEKNYQSLPAILERLINN